MQMTRLLVIISPYLAKFMKQNKSNTAFLREIVVIFSLIYLSEDTYVISSFNLMTELQELIPDAIIIPMMGTLVVKRLKLFSRMNLFNF